MKKLILDKYETEQLNKYGAVEINRNGFDILVEKCKEWDMNEMGYEITIVNPYDKIITANKEGK